ncbi:hypothetical protein AK812_SmicGene37025 [Symbiodinium microadriaticum]|uniref:Uncharacterized protein n=1 Tax=Symbiodinium microadriaticum TaxID=2951 RepID=A0A1Q9CHC5_SYMMI|nr:hypothetical protein AK812_SmicGene37025 [Symbiodinium microadriaticum]
MCKQFKKVYSWHRVVWLPSKLGPRIQSCDCFSSLQMVELSPPYFAANSSNVLRVQLRVDPPLRSPSKRKLPPTIPTVSRPSRPRQGRTSKISKTYFVGIFAPPRSKSKSSSKEASQELQSPFVHEQTKAEQRICFREGRANRFLFDRAFPALTNEAILPGWQSEKEDGPTLVKPTLSSLRRKRTMDLDRLDRDSESSPKSLAPWKPADNSRRIDHPGNVALSRVRVQSAGETKPHHINRRKTLTAQQLETFETRAAGRERAERKGSEQKLGEPVEPAEHELAEPGKAFREAFSTRRYVGIALAGPGCDGRGLCASLESVRALQSVVPSIAPGSSWAQRDIGPTLRRFFGAYYNGDVWAVYRRYKNIDVDNSGWISYDELGEILFLPEFNLLFIFDAFSQQNALIDSRELLVMVCLFSSSKLSEKCGVFLTLFDSSHSGTCTAAEVASFATLAMQVLGRCTGACVRGKDIASVMQEELSEVLPQYREAENRLGMEATFKEERIFGQDEIDEICSTFRPVDSSPPRIVACDGCLVSLGTVKHMREHPGGSGCDRVPILTESQGSIWSQLVR